jgi:hypothetical protein
VGYEAKSYLGASEFTRTAANFPPTPALATLSSKVAFLRSWVSQLEPYDISEDSLVELSVQIVRQLQQRCELDLSPEGLQKLFSAKAGQA